MKKKLSSKTALHLLKLGADRNVQKEQGFFDGRFVQRSVSSAKVYKRNKNTPTKTMMSYDDCE